MYRLLDLFSDCGGMTLGFSDPRFCGGFESAFAIDHDKAAAESYALNFGNHAACGKIKEWVAGKHIPQADIVIGGPPCQGFSLLISTTRIAGGLLWPYKGLLPAAPKDAGFQVVQAQGRCRLGYPLKGS